MRLRGKQLDSINAAIKSGGDVSAALQQTCEQADAIGQRPSKSQALRLYRLLTAAEKMDWGQVVSNGGPPCFHLCDGDLFCGRAQRWPGHNADHSFLSLAGMLATIIP